MTEATVVRGLPDGTKEEYRKLAARLVLSEGVSVSMNSLYVKALTEYIKHLKKETPSGKL